MARLPSTALQLRSHERQLAALTAIVMLAVTYWFPVRRWFSRWGATADELTRAMPGDGLIANPTQVSTQVVTVKAPPSDIWPWLAQMGDNRGGLYSYDSLDRLFGFLGRSSATSILPEFQTLTVGDKILMGSEEMIVTQVDPPRSLVLSYRARGMDWIWQFGLYPLDNENTRLVSRGTERAQTPGGWLLLHAAEPAAFVMTTRMLLNLKKRAEAGPRVAA